MTTNPSQELNFKPFIIIARKFFYLDESFIQSFDKNSFTKFYNKTAAKTKTDEAIIALGDSLLCCKKRRVIKSCLGLCVKGDAKARTFEVFVGRCDVYLNDIKICLSEGTILFMEKFSMQNL